MERFIFDSGGVRVVGDLHLPASRRPAGSVVVTGPLTSVKEQAAGVYAAALAERGFAALAFDQRNFGESGGAPRQLYDPEQTVVDVYNAVTALQQHPAGSGVPMLGLGVCIGAGPMATAAARDDRFNACASVAGGFVDDARMRTMMGEAFGTFVERGHDAEREWWTTGHSATIPAVGAEGGDVAMPLREAYEYYGTARGQVANYRNEYAVASFAHQLSFNGQPAASRLRVPFLMVHSENAVLVDEARNFYAAVRSDKSELWLESEGQVDFYDHPALVGRAVDAIASWFAQAAAPARGEGAP